MSNINVIRAAHYDETEERLRTDPVCLDMATDIIIDVLAGKVTLGTFTDSGGGPDHSFMLGANAEYRKRGGVDGGHIGAVPTAVLWIITDTMARLAQSNIHPKGGTR